MLAATASFINCTGGFNGDNPTNISRSDIDVTIRTLKNNNALTILDNIEGENKFGTAPVRAAYYALGSTQLIGDLDAISGFINTYNYPHPARGLDGEWGSVANFRFLLSSIGSFIPNASNNGENVYNLFCGGLQAYACVEQDGFSTSFIYRPPVFSDPLAMNASAAYKMAQVPRLLNDLWLLALRCTLTNP